MTKAQQKERDDAIAKLREWLKPGDTVYTILRHVSRSGMSRDISVVLLNQDGAELLDLHPNYLVAKAAGLRLKSGSRDAIVMGGCGMDMGFAIVYELSSVLFPDGFGCIGDEKTGCTRGRYCPSNDHSNGDRDYTPDDPCDNPFGGCKTTHARHWHRSGGYALRHRWL